MMSNSILVFLATWAKPSREIEPIVKEVSSEFPTIPVEYLYNGEDGVAELVTKYDARFIPTLQGITEDGSPTSSIVGIKNKAQLTEFFQSQLDWESTGKANSESQIS